MAEGVLYSVAGLLIETLGSAAMEELGLSWRVGNQFTKLQTTLTMIRAVLLDAEKKRAVNNQVRVWLERLEDVVSEADDLLDQVATEALLARRRNKLAKTAHVLIFRRKMARAIKHIKKKLDEIASDSKRFRLEGSREETGLERRARERESHSFVTEEEIVGRENDKMVVRELLLSPLGKVLSVVPVVGMGGLGKTTLARLVYNDERVRRHFDLKFWVCVSDNFDENMLIEKIVESLTDTRAKDYTVDNLHRILQKKISGKRYLLVLDDVWNESHEKWQGVKRLLSNCGAESRTLVTTRSVRVAKIMGTMEPYNLGILDREKSWSLFKKVAFDQHINDEPIEHEITKIGKEIVEKCGGIPLAINLIGSMVYFRGQEGGKLQYFQKELSNIIPQEDNSILKTLKLSYDHLPSNLKHCFAFCSLFPKDKEIDVLSLVLMWIAQGFVKSSEQNESLEDIGYEYFQELFWRSFFQEVKKDDNCNMLKTCKMHNLVHDLAVEVAGEQYKTSPFDEDHTYTNVRHVSMSSHEFPRSSLGGKRLRTMFFNPNWIAKGIDKEAICEVIFTNFKFLRMLDLSGFGLETVHNSIGKLKHLRYLDLSKNYNLEILPLSITKLVNLQTLKLNGCSKLRKLPMDIDNLVSLRHLEFHSCKNNVRHMPKGLRYLTNLQTLSNFVLTTDSSDSGSLTELTQLNKLRGKLEIKGLGSGMVTYDANLKEKKDLRSLHIEWSFIDGDSTNNHDLEKSLEGLQPHPNLAELNIEKYGGVGLANWLPSLTNLVHLRLVKCLNLEIFSSPDRFHFLKKMHLHRCRSLKYIVTNVNTDTHSRASMPTPTLPCLQELELSSLDTFEGWHFKRENTTEVSPSYFFPSLTKLTVSDCPNLALMPLYPNVKELLLKNTNRSPFKQTESMCSSSSQPFPPLSQVKHLIIQVSTKTGLQRLPNWMKNLSSLESLEIFWSSELCGESSFEFHGSILVWNNDCSDGESSEKEWPAWECFTRLKSLQCKGLPNLKLLSPIIKYFSSLHKLKIKNCLELEINTSVFDSHAYLRIVWISMVSELPSWLRRVERLEELEIWYCTNLAVIPDWISELDSLKRLKIIGCPMLKSLPGSIARIRSLCSLVIKGCPDLSESDGA